MDALKGKNKTFTLFFRNPALRKSQPTLRNFIPTLIRARVALVFTRAALEKIRVGINYYEIAGPLAMRGLSVPVEAVAEAAVGGGVSGGGDGDDVVGVGGAVGPLEVEGEGGGEEAQPLARQMYDV